MGTDQGVAHLHCGDAFFLEVGKRIHVAERFRHLPAIDEQVGDVEPVGGEVAAAGTLALGDLILVMGENEVHATGMQVEGIAEVFPDHRRALQMPARPALAPWRFPEIIPVVLPPRFPQHEV